MRLTVHLSDVVTSTEEVKTKDGFINKKKTYNTLSFSDVSEDRASSIINQLKAENNTITKHYLSGEKIPGHNRVKKK